MESDQPPQSPFAPGFEGVSSAEAQTPPTPDPYQGGEPRLGIIHLLIWTACVALVLGIDQSFSSGFPTLHCENRMATALVQSMGGGTALAGLLIWARRRYRGQAFPRYAGEYFLVVFGILTALYLANEVSGCVLMQLGEHRRGSSHMRLIRGGWNCTLALAPIVAYLASTIRLKAMRWRVVFLLCLGIEILTDLQGPVLLPHEVASFFALSFASDAAVGVALWLDWRQGLRYPWPHWLGVAAFYWRVVLQMSAFLP